jgi:hypothetical protein
MKKIALLVATIGCLASMPALGSQVTTDKPIILADDFCIGPACIGTRDRDEEWRLRHRERDRDCRDVTIRERRGDEVVERHIRRCD